MSRKALLYFLACLLIICSLPFLKFALTPIPHTPHLKRDIAPSKPTKTPMAQNIVEPPQSAVPSAKLSTGTYKTDFERVHVFYYPWYATPKHDKVWSHWNHNILPHWNDEIKKKYPHDIAYPAKDDIGSVYYPASGLYSSRDPETINSHMEQLKHYVVVISWWGPKNNPAAKDGEGFTTDEIVPYILRGAERAGAKIAFHFEPYEGRTAKSTRDDIKYIIDNYGDSPAFYRDNKTNKPVIYLYDPYHVKSDQWAAVFNPGSSLTIRGTKYDVIALALYRSLKEDGNLILSGGFDGFYTYFVAEGFTQGSSMGKWETITRWAQSHNKLISISVGPGYDDTRIRPWNAKNTKSRENGNYYKVRWDKMNELKPDFVSVTSFNEWMEGTQIEPVVPKTIEKTIYNGKKYTYQDYGSLPIDYYMTKTYEYAQAFSSKK